ncbi:MAG TPA: formate--phosphoribosylaminoimidazolecarboxamide ligase family protein [Candidatus Poseidoniales archaeon]|nr:MAG: 5-formaminoimidazole-4-carboxamide-1-(beta)-D-ribofuranosyl 5'-monophosphate synthetase [Euryarchaeota archaeon]HIA25231.1 formate--phosphoribosylaminoimidazolecarboxamide ligase family protein [Candidatus Poseidoniales archaeon]HIB23386.1 formate--phosphoribosylaminoimidazolecarboxamide ligase family protein [Candidatus Poseidoniales archaeon]HIN45200.1 formate--phosphoribosylaminoimidazolecarboxamide ligase family protein [Candidatus Poseidoniales archaeon]HIO86319.1 formate--phosphor
MIESSDISEILDNYDRMKLRIGMTASHSALDICDGAIEEGFPTVAYCQKGREKTYSEYFKTVRNQSGRVIRGMVDKAIVLDRFDEVLQPSFQQVMRDRNVVYIPNRSFTSYCGMEQIENDFRVPMFGSRNMLRMEERTEEQDYYWILDKAGLPYPEAIENPEDIDCLVIVKLHHAEKILERGFFTCASFSEYKEKSEALLQQGVIDEASLAGARIERYVIGPVFNLNFFYSPLEEEMSKLELLGVDWRFESSLDGHVRLPAPQQMTMPIHQQIPEMTVVGHNTATIRESLLEEAFALGEKFITASKEHYDPGIIGPFCLQTCIDKDMNYSIYDVAPRVGGGTNVHMSVGHPYGNSTWRKPMSSGRRIAMELRNAVEQDRLDEVLT